MSGFLSKSEKRLLEQELRLEQHAKYSDRIKTILLLDQGEKYTEIARFLFISENTVRNYEKRWILGGLDELIEDSQTGGTSRLSTEEEAQLSKHLEDKIYLTVAEIIAHIKKAYGVEFSQSGTRALLARLGFVYKKPKKAPGKANREQQEQFLEDNKELFLNKDSKNPVYFADGVHPQHNTKCAYGWIKKGEDKQIQTNTGRKRVNINGAMNAHKPDEIIIHEDYTINAQSTIELLKKIEAFNPNAETIKIIVDNALYYRAKIVKEYLLTSKIQIIFLPPYSPNLNLIERLWRFMNKVILYNQYFDKFDEFKQTVLNFFDNIQIYKQSLTSLMTLKFRTLGA